MWQASCDLQTLRLRAKLLELIRDFFSKRSVLEVQTPSLSLHTVTDPFIDSLLVLDHQQQFYLQTSPEFYMKRLLASGSGDIYQLSKVYRQDEIGNKHHREFTMLEWYRCDFSLEQLMNEVADLFSEIYILLKKQSLIIKYFSYQDCFQQIFSINPHQASVEQLQQCANDKKIHHSLSLYDDKNIWLDLLFSSCIEPKLGGKQHQPLLTFVYDYPASQAALARIEKNSINNQVAKRFEVFLSSMELGNGYFELLDPKEQKQRFIKDNVTRKKLNKTTLALDEKFLAAMEYGLPECSGVAIGIDRLIMLLSNQTEISKVLSFI